MELNNDTIYIFKEPKNKPVTIVFGNNPCPLDNHITCKHSKWKNESVELILSCNRYLKDECKLEMMGRKVNK